MMWFWTLSWSWSVLKFRWFQNWKTTTQPTKTESITLSASSTTLNLMFLTHFKNNLPIPIVFGRVFKKNTHPAFNPHQHCGWCGWTTMSQGSFMGDTVDIGILDSIPDRGENVKLCSAEPQRKQNTAISFWLLAHQKSPISRVFASPYLPAPQKSCGTKNNL